MHQASLTDVDADTLCAAIVLRPARASRNRHFALFTTDQGKLARRRASAIRSVLRDLSGACGPVRMLTCEARPIDKSEKSDRSASDRIDQSSDVEEWVLSYAMPRVSLSRSARLPAVDVSIVRVALSRRNVRLLPAPLLAREEDHAVVARLLAHAEVSIPPT